MFGAASDCTVTRFSNTKLEIWNRVDLHLLNDPMAFNIAVRVCLSRACDALVGSAMYELV